MKNVIVFINPRSRNGRTHSEFILQWLRANSFHVVNEDPSCNEDEMLRIIIKYKGTIDLIIVGGGDGSLRAALPGLLESKIPVLYLPLGTLNNLARGLNLPLSIEESLSLIHDHVVCEIDIGSANGIPFHSTLGLGISTQVNRMARSDLKRWFGVLAFVWAGLKVIYRMSPFRVHIRYDENTHQSQSWQVTVCNGKYYGSGFEISPKASLSDGLLTGQSIEARKLRPVFKFQGHEIELNTRTRMRVDLDGDIKTKTPLLIKIHPEKIKILIPKKAQ